MIQQEALLITNHCSCKYPNVCNCNIESIKCNSEEESSERFVWLKEEDMVMHK